MHQWLYIFSVWVCYNDVAAVWFLHLKEKIGSESGNAVVFCKALTTGTVQSKSAFTLSLVLLTEAACPGLMLLMFLFHFWDRSSYWLDRAKQNTNWKQEKDWETSCGVRMFGVLGGGWSLEIRANSCYWELHCLPGGKNRIKTYMVFAIYVGSSCSLLTKGSVIWSRNRNTALLLRGTSCDE